MPQIVVTKSFAFAHHGYQVEHFDASPEPRETTDECAEIACREGWAHIHGAPEVAALAAAPENRDAARKTRTRKEA